MKSPNFGFLAHLDASLVALGAHAELLFSVDPVASLVRLRLLGERLTKELAAHAGIRLAELDSQANHIELLRSRGLLHPDVAHLFHGLRKSGNQAAHDGVGSASEALHQMKIARRLGLAVLETLGRLPPTFKLGPFVPPAAPKDASEGLRGELDDLRRETESLTQAHAEALEAANLERALREDYERRIAELEQKVAETEAAFDELAASRELEVQSVTNAVAQQSAPNLQRVFESLTQNATRAAAHLDLDEAETRGLVDRQLRDAGWEADTPTLRHSLGTRPVSGRNLAIAEWPTNQGPADYALFVGLRLVALVEAKRIAKSVVGALEQARRYARGVRFDDGELGESYADGTDAPPRVPFVFATNGRPYLKQIVEESGIWFHDLRRPQNHPRALPSWHSPEGLTKLLAQDHDAAHAKLKADPVEALGLRYYQSDAIRAVERAIERGQRNILVAAATGTGKTRTCIGLVYRLLDASRFSRVLFVVDRSALGEQAEGAFKSAVVDQSKKFAEIFQLQGLDDGALENSTRLHVATIQSLVRRVLSDDPPPVDTYDCIVIDESHRGYTLDAEMSEVELGFRDEADYISKYTRVLEWFDAVKIGLTATPALHTREIFGDPVYSYTYPEAVVDGYLVDHEPPIRIVTELAQQGIAWKAGERVPTFSSSAKTEQLWLLPDDVQLEVEDFNRKVITESFNRVVCRELTKHIDPEGREKTLIFCVDDRHCDLVVRVLREAFEERLGELHTDAILKITGRSDRPRELIRRFKNEHRPTIAVTVDLLTTGIDVPEICHLVFLRRVRSRILYEQMLGRATRLCPELNKEVFKVYDAVDLYAALQDVTEMKPVATTRHVSFAQLAEELRTLEDPGAREHVLGELLAKLQRKKRRLKAEAAEQFEHLTGDTIEAFAAALRGEPVGDIERRFTPELVSFLDRALGDGGRVLISDHEDHLVDVSRGYGEGRTRPEDYLEAFEQFVRTHMNDIPALAVVAQRPRELTRKQLKDLKLALDRAGFDEPSLRTAWRQKSNVDIAASILGYVRQAALGDALVPYAERVDRALTRILASRAWDVHQTKWLRRIAEQMKASTVVDQAALSDRPFLDAGGFPRLNKIFDGQLEAVLEDLKERVWKEGA
jgi:type I restriction enzyme R subunit